MIKIALVEDEVLMAEELQKYIEQFFHNHDLDFSLNYFSTAHELLESYKEGYDLIFMDINLPKINGLDAIKSLRRLDEQVMVIFVTSLAQYALKGYEVNAFDFILKPTTYYQFTLKMNRALPLLKIKNKRNLVITNKSTIKMIDILTIIYIEVKDHKLVIHTTKGDYDSFDTINKYVDLLKNESFMLCSRSHLVNLKYVTEVDQKNVYVNEEALPISRPRRKDFLHAFNVYLGKGGMI